MTTVLLTCSSYVHGLHGIQHRDPLSSKQLNNLYHSIPTFSFRQSSPYRAILWQTAVLVKAVTITEEGGFMRKASYQ